MNHFKQDPFQTSVSVILYTEDREAFILKISDIAQGKPFIVAEQALGDGKIKLTVIAASFAPGQDTAIKTLKDDYRGQKFTHSPVAAKAVHFPDN